MGRNSAVHLLLKEIDPQVRYALQGREWGHAWPTHAGVVVGTYAVGKAWATGGGGLGGGGGGRVRRAGTHFYQVPTALDLPPREGGAQLKGHSTHSLAEENTKEKTYIALPLKTTNPPLAHPHPRGGGGGGLIPSEGGTQHFEKGRHAPPPPPRVG